VNIIKDRLHIYNAVDYYISRGSYVFYLLCRFQEGIRSCELWITGNCE